MVSSYDCTSTLFVKDMHQNTITFTYFQLYQCLNDLTTRADSLSCVPYLYVLIPRESICGVISVVGGWFRKRQIEKPFVIQPGNIFIISASKMISGQLSWPIPKTEHFDLRTFGNIGGREKISPIGPRFVELPCQIVKRSFAFYK